jgi:hypothetical protein
MNIPKEPVNSVGELKEGRFYRIADLKSILKNLGLNYSIFTIRDYETWKCLDYKCGKRHAGEVDRCTKCNGPVRPPLIISPRTRSGGKGYGHRRYTAGEIRQIVGVFMKRA